MTATAQIVSLAEAKSHLRISDNSQDDVLKIYIDAASQYIEKYLNSAIPNVYDSPPTAAPAPIKSAALLMVGDLFEQRQELVTGTIVESTNTVERLLQPYRTDIGI